MPVRCYQDCNVVQFWLDQSLIINIFEYLKISSILKHDEKLNLES